MKLLVISDSHGFIDNIKILLDKIHDTLDYVFHLGDYCDDIERFKNKYTHIKFYSVKGNCDLSPHSLDEITIKIMDKNILLTHGHKNYVKSGYDKISYKAEEINADICLFGHTHNPVLFKLNNILYINPGSISIPRGVINNPSYCIIDISENSNISASIVEIFNNGLYKVFDSI